MIKQSLLLRCSFLTNGLMSASVVAGVFICLFIVISDVVVSGGYVIGIVFMPVFEEGS